MRCSGSWLGGRKTHRLRVWSWAGCGRGKRGAGDNASVFWLRNRVDWLVMPLAALGRLGGGAGVKGRSCDCAVHSLSPTSQAHRQSCRWLGICPSSGLETVLARWGWMVFAGPPQLRRRMGPSTESCGPRSFRDGIEEKPKELWKTER